MLLFGSAASESRDVLWLYVFFFFQAEDGIRDVAVTGVQTCALPIFRRHQSDFLPVGSDVAPIPVELRGDRSVFVREAYERDDRTHGKAGNLSLLRPEARQEPNRGVVGSLPSVWGVPEPPFAGDETRCGAVLSGEGFDEPSVPADASHSGTGERHILVRIRRGSATFHRGHELAIPDDPSAIRKQRGSVVVSHSFDRHPMSASGELPENLRNITARDIRGPESFESTVAERLDILLQPHQADGIVWDPDGLADHQVCLCCAAGAASGSRE